MKTLFTKSNLIVLGVTCFFLFIKLANLSLRFGDGNAYMYMAKVLIDGKMPYRDFFLADPPVLVLVLVGLRLLVGNNLLVYQALPVLLESATAVVIYLILGTKHKLAWFVPLVYLFSFTVLSTSDYLTGVQLTVFLISLAFYFQTKEKYLWSGVFWGLAVLTKLYAIPPLVGVIIYLIINKQKKAIFKLIMSCLFAVLVVMGPFLLNLASVIDDLVIHQFNRPGGVDKLNVFSFFISKDWWLIGLGLIGSWLGRKKIFFWPFILSLIFLLIFKDLYFLYLDSLIIYLVIFTVQQLDRSKYLAMLVISLSILMAFLTLSDYSTNFLIKGRFQNAGEIASYVRSQPNYPLYGSHEVAPVIAMLADRPLFANLIDTNGQAFASGALDLNKVSGEAVNSGVLMLARITDRPDLGIRNSGYESFFKADYFKKYCSSQKEFTSTANELDNHIVIYLCKK